MSTLQEHAGLLGTKLGMTQTWDENNRVVPVTVIQAGPCVVTGVRTADRDGYDGVQIAFGDIDPRKVTKPLRGHFDKAGVTPRRHLMELRTADASEYTLGQEIKAEAFEAGERVDVSATSKGKGFAGVMKRHGFHGLRATHGVHKKHRSPVPSAAAPPRAGSSRACGWRAGWAPSRSRRRTSACTRSTPSAA
jgi:large subunit ribosomal protein L3